MRRLGVVNEKPRELTSDPYLPEGAGKRPYKGEPDTTTEKGRIEQSALEGVQEIFDPEIPVNVFELGLIYGIDVDDAHNVHIQMTLTAPNCPVAQSLPEQVRQAAESADGVASATIDVVWDPPWNRGMMSEEARLDLNL